MARAAGEDQIGLYTKQLVILNAIDALTKDRRRPPSMAEIGIRVQRTKSNVHLHVTTLRKLGYVEYDGSKWRTIRLTEKGRIAVAEQISFTPREMQALREQRDMGGEDRRQQGGDQ